jgi:flagellar basal-body rod protein FlgB
MSVTPAQLDMLNNVLRVSELRHRAISQNIANVNTPGYRRRDVSFEEAVREILAAEAGEVLPGIQPEICEVEGLPSRADGNNVDIDREMGALGKNSLLYQTVAQVLASRLGTMRSAITGK